MAYKPAVKTTSSTAIEACPWDESATRTTITNLSGETCYMSPDPDVASSGSNRGEPIFNNGRFEATVQNGSDPRIARWVIGVVGGTIVVGREQYLNDPFTSALNRLVSVVEQIVALINAGLQRKERDR